MRFTGVLVCLALLSVGIASEIIVNAPNTFLSSKSNYVVDIVDPLTQDTNQTNTTTQTNTTNQTNETNQTNTTNQTNSTNETSTTNATNSTTNGSTSTNGTSQTNTTDQSNTTSQTNNTEFYNTEISVNEGINTTISFIYLNMSFLVNPLDIFDATYISDYEVSNTNNGFVSVVNPAVNYTHIQSVVSQPFSVFSAPTKNNRSITFITNQTYLNYFNFINQDYESLQQFDEDTTCLGLFANATVPNSISMICQGNSQVFISTVNYINGQSALTLSSNSTILLDTGSSIMINAYNLTNNTVLVVYDNNTAIFYQTGGEKINSAIMNVTGLSVVPFVLDETTYGVITYSQAVDSNFSIYVTSDFPLNNVPALQINTTMGALSQVLIAGQAVPDSTNTSLLLPIIISNGNVAQYYNLPFAIDDGSVSQGQTLCNIYPLQDNLNLAAANNIIVNFDSTNGAANVYANPEQNCQNSQGLPIIGQFNFTGVDTSNVSPLAITQNNTLYFSNSSISVQVNNMLQVYVIPATTYDASVQVTFNLTAIGTSGKNATQNFQVEYTSLGSVWKGTTQTWLIIVYVILFAVLLSVLGFLCYKSKVVYDYQSM